MCSVKLSHRLKPTVLAFKRPFTVGTVLKKGQTGEYLLPSTALEYLWPITEQYLWPITGRSQFLQPLPSKLLHSTMNNSVHCSALQCIAVQCTVCSMFSILKCSAVQCSPGYLGSSHLYTSCAHVPPWTHTQDPVQCSAVQWSTLQCKTVLCSAMQCSAVQCSICTALLGS